MSAKGAKRRGGAGREGRGRAIVVALVVVGISVAAAFLLTGPATPDHPPVLGGERRPALSPGYFVGKTARAYQAAQEIPQIIDKIYCYCRCQENHGHKSLLTCFVDKHGSQCGICMDEALMAYDLHKKGLAPDRIAKEVDAYFSRPSKRL